jgi:hypothetical protein
MPSKKRATRDESLKRVIPKKVFMIEKIFLASRLRRSMTSGINAFYYVAKKLALWRFPHKAVADCTAIK